jgi:predicted ATPase
MRRDRNLQNSQKYYKNYLKLLSKADFSIENVRIDENFKGESSNINKYEIKTVHFVRNNKYSLDFVEESLGTQQYFSLIGLLLLSLESNTLLNIDELESSLHPDLFNHFLLTYLVNGKKQSQLIATTHNREILNNKDVFRDDAVWFTDKNFKNFYRKYLN